MNYLFNHYFYIFMKLLFKFLLISFFCLSQLSCTEKIKKEYDSNGKLRSEREIDDGEYNGFYKIYNENEILIESGNLINGKKNGEVKYFDELGNLIKTAKFENGIPNGLVETFFQNGNKQSKGYFKDGLQDGLTQAWYENGAKKSITNHKRGNRNGECFIFFENGNLKKECEYIDGELIYNIDYNEEGIIVDELRIIKVIASDTVIQGKEFEIVLELLGPEIAKNDSTFLMFEINASNNGVIDFNSEVVEMKKEFIVDNKQKLNFSIFSKGEFTLGGAITTNFQKEGMKSHTIPHKTFYVVEN